MLVVVSPPLEDKKRGTTMNKIAIVILNWNTRTHLETFLPSLIRNTDLNQNTLVVADNGSTDDSIAFLRQHYPQIILIQLDRNYGFAGGYNLALKQIQASYYVLINSDIEVTENWLQPLITVMDNSARTAACMPKLLSYVERSSFEYAGAAGGYIDYLGFPFCRGRIFQSVEVDVNQYNGLHEIFWATGACMVIRAEVFHQLGGFDSYFFAHQEEIDLCWRIYHAGYNILCNTDSVVYHLGGGTLPKTNPRKTFLNFRNNLILLYKNLPKGNLFPIFFSKLVLDGMAGIYFLMEGKPKDTLAVIKGHFHFYGYVLRHRIANRPEYSNSLPIYRKSIVWQYFFCKKRKYAELPDLPGLL